MVYFYYRLYLNINRLCERPFLITAALAPYSGSFRTTYFRGKYARFRLHYQKWGGRLLIPCIWFRVIFRSAPYGTLFLRTKMKELLVGIAAKEYFWYNREFLLIFIRLGSCKTSGMITTATLYVNPKMHDCKVRTSVFSDSQGFLLYAARLRFHLHFIGPSSGFDFCLNLPSVYKILTADKFYKKVLKFML